MPMEDFVLSPSLIATLKKQDLFINSIPAIRMQYPLENVQKRNDRTSQHFPYFGNNEGESDKKIHFSIKIYSTL